VFRRTAAAGSAGANQKAAYAAKLATKLVSQVIALFFFLLHLRSKWVLPHYPLARLWIVSGQSVWKPETSYPIIWERRAAVINSPHIVLLLPVPAQECTSSTKAIFGMMVLTVWGTHANSQGSSRQARESKAVQHTTLIKPTHSWKRERLYLSHFLLTASGKHRSKASQACYRNSFLCI
jgi:hypothetical protein